MENINRINNEIGIENESRVNNAISFIMICFAMIEVIFILLFYLFPDIFVFFDNGYALFALSILILIPAIVQWASPRYIKWMKYVLMITMLLMVTYLDYVFSIGSFALFILPTLLCAQYNSKKFSLSIFGLSILALTINSVAIYITAKNGVYKSIFNFDFSNPIITFVNFYLVKLIIYTIFAVTSMATMNNTKYAVKKQVDYSNNLISIKSEIDTASKIQMSILPTNFNLAVDQGFYLSALMKPAKEVAGDFYDFYYINNKLYIIVGDVSDKGLSAAMFMMNVKNTIRALSNNETDITKILTAANKIISDNNKELMFVTIWMASIELDTGKGEYINAGHCPAFIKDSNNVVSKLDSEPQLIIGVDGSVSYFSNEFVIPLGCNLFIYTDGVTDAINNEGISFGEAGITKSLMKDGCAPTKVIENISEDIFNHVGEEEQFDDITILSLNYHGFDFEKNYDYKIENVRDIVDNLNAVLENNNVDEEIIDNIDSAIDDVVSNIIDYSQNEKNDTFTVKYSLFAGNLVISFIDSGVEFNPLEMDSPDLSEDRKIGGLGIYLFRNIMDESFYKRFRDQNILTLVKKLD